MKKSSKADRLYNNLLRVSEQFMLGRNFVPSTRSELMGKLHLGPEHKEVFQEVLKALVEKGVAKYSKGKYHPRRKNVDIIKGVLRLNKRGFGFVTPDDPTLYDQDIFIPKHLTQNAVDQDVVEVEINTLTISEKGPEGKIINILKRGRTHLAGIVRAIEGGGERVAYAPLLGLERRIILQPDDLFDLQVGDRIVMEVIDWGSNDSETTCRTTHFIGHITQPEYDIASAIEEFDLPDAFPTEAIEEAKSFGKSVAKADWQHRVDLREKESITIDPDTAKDFDDALSLEVDNKGVYHLGVHIADVSHYVLPDSAIDKEAKERCNSTYFPGTCLPMLPKELSENLCSLKPKVNRLAVTVMMRFSSCGSLIGYDFFRSVIHSKKRFTYKEAKLVLEGKKTSPFLPLLQRLVDLCYLLKKKRYERGSIEFSLPELVIHVDGQGNPTHTEQVFYDITHQMVEEFMLKANEVVAAHLSKEGRPLAYRIHEEPSAENMQDFVQLAHAFGFHLPSNPSAQDLQLLFDEALQTPYGSFLATSYIRRLKLAMYSPENIGHYGLGLTHYCHFTSPIRRYADLVVHRVLLGNSLEQSNLEQITKFCSEQERISERAENHVKLLKKLRLVQHIMKQDPHKEFRAVVTKVRGFGIYFEVLDFMLEGFFHLSELEDDFYKFEEKNARLVGVYTGRAYFAGDQLTLLAADVDLILLQAKWHLVSDRPLRSKKDAKEKASGRRRKAKKKTSRK